MALELVIYEILQTVFAYLNIKDLGKNTENFNIIKPRKNVHINTVLHIHEIDVCTCEL